MAASLRPHGIGDDVRDALRARFQRLPTDVQQQMVDYGTDIKRAAAICDGLKRDITRLLAERDELDQDNASSRFECEGLARERDALQAEIAALTDDIKYYSAEGAVAMPLQQLDAVGRASRQLWVQTEKVRQLEGRLADAEGARVRDVAAEREVARGLRSEVARLQHALRDDERGGESPPAASTHGATSAETEGLKYQVAVLQDDMRKLRSENGDIRDSLRLESKSRAVADKLAEALTEQLHLAQEEARHYKQLAADRDQLERKLKAVKDEMATRAANVCDARRLHPSPRPLQRMSSNISLAPHTPSKTPGLSDLLGSPPDPGVSGTSPDTPSTLAKRYEYLQNRHNALKAQFDKMRAKYADDIRHWKEWRSIHDARRELRHKRKAAATTAAAASGTGGGGSVEGGETQAAGSPLPPSAADAVSAAADVADGDAGGPRIPAGPSPKSPTPALSPSPQHLVSGVSASSATAPAPAHPVLRASASTPALPSQESKSTNLPSRVLSDPVPTPQPQSQSRSTALTIAKAASTPARTAAATPLPARSVNLSYTTPTATESRILSRQPSRVTPWLGSSTRKTASAKVGAGDASAPRRRRSSFSDEDEDSGHEGTAAAAGVHASLVRDRIGAGGGDVGTSLRKAALQRRAAHSLGPSSDTFALDTSADADSPESPHKRKLDHGTLSPAERAAERKKLSRLSSARRREVYAPYKGKGRYVAPDAVRRTAADEYEIDPARNEGAGYAFHSVVRGREERRKLHGGDCECCRDYYEAIGPLPRFNDGPAWRSPPRGAAGASTPSAGGSDGPDADAAEAADALVPLRHDLADHQNRVSRHREAWRKPPTPPDFWKIGFPSTQDVARVNEVADDMARRRDAELRREAAHKNSKWRKKL